MTGPAGAGGDDSGPPCVPGGSVPSHAWCKSSSVGNTQFEFTWHIADYQRKKESIKRDDSIQSSTFTVQANGKKSRWYLTFLPNGAAEDEEDTDHDDHEDDSDITIHGIDYGYLNEKDRVKKEGEEEYSSKIISDMERLLDSGTLTDVTIKCENRILECHKAVLSARSTVFRAMFQHDMRESKSNEIHIPDIDFATVRDMVRFIYSGRLKDLADKSDLLLAAADKYDIRDLKSICCQHLASNLSTEQIVDVLVLADIHKATELKSQAIQYLLHHKEEVFSQPDWKHKLKNHPDILMEVLESTVDTRDAPLPNKRRRKK